MPAPRRAPRTSGCARSGRGSATRPSGAVGQARDALHRVRRQALQFHRTPTRTTRSPASQCPQNTTVWQTVATPCWVGQSSTDGGGPLSVGALVGDEPILSSKGIDASCRWASVRLIHRAPTVGQGAGAPQKTLVGTQHQLPGGMFSTVCNTLRDTVRVIGFSVALVTNHSASNASSVGNPSTMSTGSIKVGSCAWVKFTKPQAKAAMASPFH